MPIDWNNIREKSIISLIDKLIIGVLAAAIAFGVQHRIDESEKERLQKFSVAKLESDELIRAKTDINTIMRSYFLLLETLETINYKAEDTQKVLLSDYRANFKFYKNIVGIFSDRLNKKADPVLQKMSDINKEIRKVNSDNNIITNYINDLKNKYKELISDIRNEAIRAIEKEREISN